MGIFCGYKAMVWDKVVNFALQKIIERQLKHARS